MAEGGEAKLPDALELLQRLPVGIYETDRDGAYVYVNARWCRLAGLDADRAQGDGWLESVHPEDRVRVAAAWRDALDRGAELHTEYRLRTADAEPLWVANRASPKRSGFVGTIVDITEIKTAQEAVVERESRIRAILETAVEGIVTIDASGIVRSLNPAAEHMFGYAAGEVVGRNVSMLMPSPFREEHDDYLAAYLATGEARIIGIGREVEGVRKDGSRFPIYLSVGEQRLEDDVRFTGILRDISAEKATERALDESRRTFATLVENLPGMVYRRRHDDAWTMELVSGGCHGVTGYEPAELEQSARLSYVELIHPDDVEAVQRTVDEAVRARQPFVITYRIETASGDPKTVIERGCGVFEPSGKLYAVEGFIADVTETKRLEQEFQEAQKMEAIGRLAGGIAHDFNNLLMGILGGCRMAAGMIEDGSEAKRICEQIQRETLKGTTLTRQLLDFSRRRTYEKSVVDLNEVVVEAEAMLAQLIGEDIETSIRLSPVDAPVVADRGRLDQILMNLCVNARDAMPEGGRLEVEVSSARGDEGDEGNWVLLAVSDTGCGMDAATQARAFEPFFTTKEVGKGTGLGLSTVFGLVKEFGGHIELESEPGDGTRFRLWFPRSEPAAGTEPPAAGAAAGDPSTVETGTETVLVVEDEPLVRAGVRHLLEGLGYTVLVAARPSEALGLAAQHVVQLLLSDIVMPEMNGPELAREMRARYPGLRVLFMSAYSDAALVEQGRIEPGQPVLEKPFEEAELAAMVRQVLSAGRATR
jgi:PAS domain S-box-containing protein